MSLLCSCLDMWCPILFSRSTSELLERIYEIKHWHLLNRNFISMKRVSVREIWTDWSSSRAEDVGDCLMSHSHCHTNTQLWFELNWAQFELNWALIWAKLSWINWAKLNPYTISSAVSGLFSVRVGTGSSKNWVYVECSLRLLHFRLQLPYDPQAQEARTIIVLSF